MNGKLLPFGDLDRVASTKREGYRERILELGELRREKEIKDSFIFISDENWMKMKLENWDLPRPIGLGDKLHKVLGPIGRAIGWPCVKKDGTTDLIPGSPCAKARDDLNKLTT